MAAHIRPGPPADTGSGEGPAISVVVPVHNEESNIAPLVAEIDSALAGGEPFEIVYVDDGSSDKTTESLRAAAADCPRLRLFRHRRRYGQSAALATGIGLARGAIVATMDGDGQNDPADIPRLLAAFRAEADPDRILVAGHRTRREDGWLRRLSSRVANGVRGTLLKDRTPDTGCGLKVFARAAFLAMPRFDHMHRFLPALMIRQGGRVLSVPVNHRRRQRGASHYGVFDRLWVGIADVLGLMWLMRRASLPVVDDLQAGDER